MGHEGCCIAESLDEWRNAVREHWRATSHGLDRWEPEAFVHGRIPHHRGRPVQRGQLGAWYVTEMDGVGRGHAVPPTGHDQRHPDFPAGGRERSHVFSRFDSSDEQDEACRKGVRLAKGFDVVVGRRCEAGRRSQGDDRRLAPKRARMRLAVNEESAITASARRMARAMAARSAATKRRRKVQGTS